VWAIAQPRNGVGLRIAIKKRLQDKVGQQIDKTQGITV
jgi:hypothetical protein